MKHIGPKITGSISDEDDVFAGLEGWRRLVISIFAEESLNLLRCI